MKIQVLGSGCPTCKKLYELTQKAIEELDLNEKVEYITDINKIIEMGVMSSPVLAIDGKPVMVGFSNSIEKIKELITKGTTSNLDSADEKSCCGSDCECDDGNCQCSDGSCDMSI